MAFTLIWVALLAGANVPLFYMLAFALFDGPKLIDGGGKPVGWRGLLRPALLLQAVSDESTVTSSLKIVAVFLAFGIALYLEYGLLAAIFTTLPIGTVPGRGWFRIGRVVPF